jgi:succinate dehydrogenase/fumarate reductase flavoprotein subunit
MSVKNAHTSAGAAVPANPSASFGHPLPCQRHQRAEQGGLRTDARARVLRKDGSVIDGLYAAGNASAAVMGHSYAGAGATIGPAMTFGYIAAHDLVSDAPV